MKKRPLSVTIGAWLFIAAGAVGFTYHFSELQLHNLFAQDTLWIEIIRVLAIIGGIAVLRAAGWGRLLTAWMAFHVVISYFHSIGEMAMHAALLAVVLFLFFNPKANDYFKNSPSPHSVDEQSG